MGLLGKLFGADKNNSSNFPFGYEATRKDKSAEWVISKKIIEIIDFNEMKNNIYPWVKKSLSEPPDNETEIVLDVPEKALIADLFLLFVVDMGDVFHVLQQKDVPSHLTIDDLCALAVENLKNNITFRLAPAKFDGGYGLLAGGDHEAGALCLDDLWEDCAAHIGENLLVAVPSKDVVLMVGQSQANALEEMKTIALEIIKDGDRALTEHIFLYDVVRKKFTIYE